MVVDLPAPFGPRKPVTTPGWTVKLSSSTAVFSPYRLLSPRDSIMVGLLLGGGDPNLEGLRRPVVPPPQ